MLFRCVAVSLDLDKADAAAADVDRFLKLGPRRNGRLRLLLLFFFGLVSDCRRRRLWLDTFMACYYNNYRYAGRQARFISSARD